MSSRRSRARAQNATAARVPAAAAPAAGGPRRPADPGPAAARPEDDLHRRAVEMREYRMGRGARPKGLAAPSARTEAGATVSLTYPVLGMTCRTCEVRIAKFVGQLPNVERVTASAARGQVTVETSGPVAPAAIERAINKAGYEIGRSPWLATDPRVWATAGLGILVVAAIAVLASVTGVGDLANGAGDLSQGGLVVGLLLGLAAGVSTCMALVGGLVLGLSAAFQATRPAGTGPAPQMRPAIVFVVGRVAGYAVFGAALGAVGASITMPPQVTAVLMVAVAVVMLILGARLTELSPRVAGWSPTLPMGLGRRLGLGGEAAAGGYSDARAAALGAASFFLPCGFTQAIQVFALSTGSPLYAAALLGTFALGTAPGLLALAGLPLVVPVGAKPTLLRLVGVVVIGFALLNGSAGLRLSGFSLPALVGTASAAPLPGTLGPDGIQRITTYQGADGYSPGNVVIYAGYPTKWTVQSSTTSTCAASLWAPDVNIRARLQKGANTFDLPAMRAGVLNYSCAMGMYGGRITVVDGPPEDSAAGAASRAPDAGGASAAPGQASVATPAPGATDDAISRPFGAGPDTAGASSPPAGTNPGDAASTPPSSPAAAPARQELRTYQDEGGYGPADAVITAGIPTTWHVDSRSQYGCSAYIVVPSLNIEVVLKPGDNVIDLPALPAGKLEYTCAMGMFYGVIAVQPAGASG